MKANRVNMLLSFFYAFLVCFSLFFLFGYSKILFTIVLFFGTLVINFFYIIDENDNFKKFLSKYFDNYTIISLSIIATVWLYKESRMFSVLMLPFIFIMTFVFLSSLRQFLFVFKGKWINLLFLIPLILTSIFLIYQTSERIEDYSRFKYAESSRKNPLDMLEFEYIYGYSKDDSGLPVEFRLKLKDSTYTNLKVSKFRIIEDGIEICRRDNSIIIQGINTIEGFDCEISDYWVIGEGYSNSYKYYYLNGTNRKVLLEGDFGVREYELSNKLN